MTNYMDMSHYGHTAGFQASQWPQTWTGGASNPVGSALQSRATNSGLGSGGGGSRAGISGFGKDLGSSTPLGMNIGTAQLALGGLQAIGSLWGAWQANKIAKEQNALAREKFQFQKGFATKNMANQIQSYNTTLKDRSFSRAHTQNEDRSVAEDYIQKHRLSEFKG